jgi:hypothetical protein
MDLTAAITPKSDQINAEDLLAGPRTFTIAEVREGSVEQPVNVHLVESPGKPFRPSKTVLRIFVTAWGSDSSTFAGQRITLYRDPTVRFGGQDVGGIRVSHMSGITKPLKLALTVSKGKRSQYVVDPLPDAPAPTQKKAKVYTLDELIEKAQAALSNEVLNQIAKDAVADLSGDDLETVKAVVTARRAELKAAPAEPTLDWPDVKQADS